MLVTVGIIFNGKAKGLEFAPDPDDTHAHVAYTVSLAIEALLNVITSLNTLADRAAGDPVRGQEGT